MYGVRNFIGLNSMVILCRKFCLVNWNFLFGGFILYVKIFFLVNYNILSVFIDGKFFLFKLIFVVLFFLGIFLSICFELESYFLVCMFVDFYSVDSFL